MVNPFIFHLFVFMTFFPFATFAERKEIILATANQVLVWGVKSKIQHFHILRKVSTQPFSPWTFVVRCGHIFLALSFLCWRNLFWRKSADLHFGWLYSFIPLLTSLVSNIFVKMVLVILVHQDRWVLYFKYSSVVYAGLDALTVMCEIL